MKSAGATLPGSGVRATGLCAQLTAGTARQWGSAAASSSDPGSGQVDRVYIYPFPYCWLHFQSQMHKPLPEVPTTVLLKRQFSGLQCLGQIRAETAILWYVLLRTCLYGDTTCGVGLVLTSSVWSVKRMRSSLCIYDYIDMCFLRQD